MGTVVALAQPKEKDDASDDDDPRRGCPARRCRLCGLVSQLPCRHRCDQIALVELEPCAKPPVAADALGEDSHAIVAGLDCRFRDAPGHDLRSRHGRLWQVENDLALRDAVSVLGRERIPLEDVERPLSLHDSAHHIREGERVRRIGARREIPADAHFRPVPHLDEARTAADGHVTSIHGRADDLDVVGAPARQLAKDVGEGPAFETEDNGFDDFHGAAVEDADAHVEAVRDIRLGRRSRGRNQEERRE